MQEGDIESVDSQPFGTPNVINNNFYNTDSKQNNLSSLNNQFDNEALSSKEIGLQGYKTVNFLNQRHSMLK